jgi:hypothetical protein
MAIHLKIESVANVKRDEKKGRLQEKNILNGQIFIHIYIRIDIEKNILCRDSRFHSHRVSSREDHDGGRGLPRFGESGLRRQNRDPDFGESGLKKKSGSRFRRIGILRQNRDSNDTSGKRRNLT